MKQPLIIRIIDGQWYATQNGKHLTAQETFDLIARGTPYQFEQAETRA